MWGSTIVYEWSHLYVSKQPSPPVWTILIGCPSGQLSVILQQGVNVTMEWWNKSFLSHLLTCYCCANTIKVWRSFDRKNILKYWDTLKSNGESLQGINNLGTALYSCTHMCGASHQTLLNHYWQDMDQDTNILYNYCILSLNGQGIWTMIDFKLMAVSPTHTKCLQVTGWKGNLQ